ncbi:MAG: tyrosine-type recombinase/integrase [Burkholderiaceae bacterium]|nr:tyrosine-type recombinase/integrase [Burkholderiaceae bacterium]
MTPAVNPRLIEHVAAYLAHARALGHRYRQEEWLLRTLLRELPALGHTDLGSDSVAVWFDRRRHLHANTRRKWAQQLRRFCLFRRRAEPDCFAPLPEFACRAQPYVMPVIIEERQVASMLAAADALEPQLTSPSRPAAMRIAVVLLYTTGMRLGELQRLTLGDVEDSGAVLRVHESKFHKSRLLPLSASAQAELLAYLERRCAAGFDAHPAAPLLCTRARRSTGAYSISGLQHALNSLLRGACPAPRPRIHDLRHSFAVQALARWYRQGADVQAQLPKLAMYMGHASIESTAYYLRWTETIAGLASRRFEQHFATAIGGRS